MTVCKGCSEETYVLGRRKYGIQWPGVKKKKYKTMNPQYGRSKAVETSMKGIES